MYSWSSFIIYQILIFTILFVLSWPKVSTLTPAINVSLQDKYGNEIKKLGRPLPVEYLLIDVPVSTPKEPQATFPILKVGTWGLSVFACLRLEVTGYF